MLGGVLPMSFRCQKGAILVSVIVALGASLVAMVALSQLVSTSSLAVNAVHRNFEADIATSMIRETVRDPATCMATFGNVVPTINRTIPQIQRGGTIYYSVGSSMVTGTNRINSITQLATAIGPNQRGFQDVRVTYRVRGRALGSNLISRRFRLSITTNGINRISDCSGSPFQVYRDCVHLTTGLVGGGSIFSPSCPAGYTVTGGGIYDGNWSNDDQGTIQSGDRWHCRNDDPPGGMRCAVICCR